MRFLRFILFDFILILNICFYHGGKFTRKLARRKGLRAQFIKVLKEAQEYLIGDSFDEARLIGFETSLREKGESIKVMDDDIGNDLEPADIENDVIESLEFFESSHEVFAKLSVKLKKLEFVSIQGSGTDLNVSLSSTGANVRSKLPKLEIPVLCGNPLEWQGFWDQFNVSVNLNSQVSDVDKFNYLKRFLSGKALSTIQGLSLSS